MLEKIPSAVGSLLRGIRPGLGELVVADERFKDAADSISVTSRAFADATPIPAEFTADGEGRSPPLMWCHVPEGTAAIVLIIEDADSPTPEPLVHAIAWDLRGCDGGIPEGALPRSDADGAAPAMGRNSYLGAYYLPPDPPSGHGPHRYAFQVFALAQPLAFDEAPGRRALLDAMATARVLAKGVLIGTYLRP